MKFKTIGRVIGVALMLYLAVAYVTSRPHIPEGSPEIQASNTRLKNTPERAVEFIAHAGGMIDGHTYTNSKEAIELSIAQGCTYFEVDLQLTSDDVLVCVHDWAQFNLMCHHEERGKKPMSYAEFKTCKLWGKYTPLSAEDIAELLKAHPHVFLVVDKTSDIALMNQYFYPYRARLAVETSDMGNYFDLMDAGYFRPMYATKCYVPLKRLFYPWLWHRGQICWIVASYSFSEELAFQWNMALGIRYAVSSINTRTTIETLKPQIQMVYTDKLYVK